MNNYIYQTPPAVKPAHQPRGANTAFREETVQLITDIIFTLGALEERVRKLEEKEDIRSLSEEDNWLNNLIDEVNKSVRGETTP